MEGIYSGIYEIFEVILAVFLLLVIGGITIAVSSPHYLQATATATEVSYIATLVSNYDTKVQLKYEDTEIDIQEKNILLSYKNTDTLSKGYFGDEVAIVKKTDGNYVLNEDVENG